MAYFFAMCYKELGQQYGYSDLYMTIVGGLYNILCGTTRVFWGWVNQLRGFKFTMVIIVIGEVNIYIYIYIYYLGGLFCSTITIC